MTARCRCSKCSKEAKYGSSWQVRHNEVRLALYDTRIPRSKPTCMSRFMFASLMLCEERQSQSRIKYPCTFSMSMHGPMAIGALDQTGEGCANQRREAAGRCILSSRASTYPFLFGVARAGGLQKRRQQALETAHLGGGGACVGGREACEVDDSG